MDANVRLNKHERDIRDGLFPATVPELRVLPNLAYTHEKYWTGQRSVLDYICMSWGIDDDTIGEVDYSENDRSDRFPWSPWSSCAVDSPLSTAVAEELAGYGRIGNRRTSRSTAARC